MVPTAPSSARARADKMYSTDRASHRLGITIESVSAGTATMRMRVTQDMMNGHRVAHGGVLFTLADAAFAYACNGYDQSALAQSCSIDFVRAAKLGDELVAEAIERNRSQSGGIYDVTVRRVDGTAIAFFRGKSKNLKHPFPESTSSS